MPAPAHEPFLHPLQVDSIQANSGGWLITSPEYHMKRLLAAGAPTRIFQICRCFRGDEAGVHHRPEFTMIEWYRTHVGYGQISTDVERLVAHTARSLSGSDVVTGPGGERTDLRTPWPRINVTDAFRRFAGIDIDLPAVARQSSQERTASIHSAARAAGCHSIDEGDDWDSAFNKLLIERVEPGLASTGRGVHLRRYPVSMAALARIDPQDATVAQRCESYAGGLELSNGFQELTDARQQRHRFLGERQTRRLQGKEILPLDEPFLRDLERMPPASGVALGLDRLIMLVTGAGRIDDVVAF